MTKLNQPIAPKRVTRSKYPYITKSSDMQTPIGESLTVEGEALTLRQLLTDYTGNPGAYARPAYFEEESSFASQDLSKIYGLDLVDKEMLLTAVKQKISNLSEAIGQEKIKQEIAKKESEENKKTVPES